jgi:predicted acyltransferase
MKFKKLDELQYIKRGNIFKHCLFTVIGLLLLYYTVLGFDIVIMSQRNAILLIIIFTVSLFCIEMIWNEIYPISEKRQKFLYFILGLFGFAVIILSAYEMITGKACFMEREIISDTGTGFIMGCLLFMIFAAYILRKITAKKKGEMS